MWLRQLGIMHFPTTSKSRGFISSDRRLTRRRNTLLRDPLVQICGHESDQGSTEAHKGNTSLLDQSADKTLGTTQSTRRVRNVK